MLSFYQSISLDFIPFRSTTIFKNQICVSKIAIIKTNLPHLKLQNEELNVFHGNIHPALSSLKRVQLHPAKSNTSS